MPKDPSSRSLLSPKSRGTLCSRPYPSNGRGVNQGGSSSKEGAAGGEERKDWEESTCPICMEYPHNAVLLLCSSHDKGCRPYMCDTSYRHSNCLDQYRKAKTANDKSNNLDSADAAAAAASLESVTGGPGGAVVPLSMRALTLEMENEMQQQRRSFLGHHHNSAAGIQVRNSVLASAAAAREAAGERLLALRDRLNGGDPSALPTPSMRGLVRGLAMEPESIDTRTSDAAGAEFLAGSIGMGAAGGSLDLDLDLEDARAATAALPGGDANVGEVADLLCPLCRGKVFGWKVIDPARHQLNRKPRGCAQEACSFTGTYKELREHARAVHPSARPSDIDPARQRDWRRLERQRDLGDVLSTIRSAMPGSTVWGDYVIDDEDEEHEDEGDDSDFPGDDGNWWTVFMLFQFFGPAAPFAGGRGLPGRMNRMTRGPSGSPVMRGALWGENFQGSGIGGGINNLNVSSVSVEGGLGGSTTSRRRRSRPRSRGDIL